jgi:GNAT superfamily N-acetyltransferase
MTSNQYIIRRASVDEFQPAGQLLVEVYSQLPGFPTPSEQPTYYQMLAQVGLLTERPGAELLVAISETGSLDGVVVYFNDMQYYGSGGSATQEGYAAGFRLLGVHPRARGKGLGKLLTKTCLIKAKEQGKRQVIIHTTEAMQTAWRMYETLGFQRSTDLDFLQGTLPVYGFRLSTEALD